MNMKYCFACGGKLEEDASFCILCGSDLKNRRVMEQIDPQPEQPAMRSRNPYKSGNAKSATSETIPSIGRTPNMPKNMEDAQFIDRVMALLLDLIIIGIISSIITAIVFMPLYFKTNDWSFPMRGFSWSFLSYFIGFMYFWLCESKNGGQTPGKKAMHLKTVDINTFKVSDAKSYALHSLTKGSPLMILDVLAGLIINKDEHPHQIRFTEQLSNTIVVKVHS